MLQWTVFTCGFGELLPVTILAVCAFLYGESPEKTVLRFVGHSTATLVAFGVLFAVIGDRRISLAKRGQKHEHFHWLGALLLMIVVLPLYFYCYLNDGIDWPRATVFSLPAIGLLTAAGAYKYCEFLEEELARN